MAYIYNYTKLKDLAHPGSQKRRRDRVLHQHQDSLITLYTRLGLISLPVTPSSEFSLHSHDGTDNSFP